MPSVQGNYSLPYIVDNPSAVISSNISVADDYVTFDASILLSSAAASVTQNNLPISMNANVLANSLKGFAGSGNDIFYNRIIISPSSIDAGNIVTLQSYPISVWNGYFANRTILSITGNNAVGTALETLINPPATMFQLEEKTWNLSILTDGPAFLNASYSIVFDNSTEIIAAFGARTFAWLFFPDWSRPLLERLQWSTNIIESYDGSEQRIATRKTPKRFLEYQFGITTGKERRRFENILYNWGARSFLIPIWWEGQQLSSTLTAGSTSVTLPRVSEDWVIGGNAIFRESNLIYEVCEVSQINGNVITFASPTNFTWNNSTSRLYPAVVGNIDGDISVNRFTGDQVLGVCRFTIESNGNSNGYTPILYRSNPVVNEISDWSRNISADYKRKLLEIDYGTGKIFRDDQAGIPFIVTQHHFVKDGYAAIDSLRKFFYSMKGRQKVAWWPTWIEDLLPKAAITSNFIDVENNDISQHIALKQGRKDILIQLIDGTIFYRRITGVVETDDNIERVSIDSNVPYTLPLANIRRISWLIPSRLESDSVEFAWRFNDWCEASTNIRMVRDGI